MKSMYCAVALVTLVACPSIADVPPAIESAQFATITSPAGESRALVQFMLPTLASNARVDQARLHVDLSGTAIEGHTLTLQVHPLTAPWSMAAADWESGWETPGGDIARGIYNRVEVDLSRGETTIGIDVLLLVKEMLEGGLGAHGFLITVPPYLGEGVRSTDSDWLAGFASARLELETANHSSIPRWTSKDVSQEGGRE